MSRIFALFFICLMLPSAAMPQSAPSASPGPGGSTYLIQPNDLLEIFVNEEPTWSRKVVVQPDGWISVPQA